MFKDIMLFRSNYIICLLGQPLTNSRSGQGITDNNNTTQFTRLCLASPCVPRNVIFTNSRKRSIIYDLQCS